MCNEGNTQNSYETLCAIWYYLYNFKREKHLWRSDTFSKVAGQLTLTPERFSVFIVNFEHASHLFIVFLMLTLMRKYLFAGF